MHVTLLVSNSDVTALVSFFFFFFFSFAEQRIPLLRRVRLSLRYMRSVERDGRDRRAAAKLQPRIVPRFDNSPVVGFAGRITAQLFIRIRGKNNPRFSCLFSRGEKIRGFEYCVYKSTSSYQLQQLRRQMTFVAEREREEKICGRLHPCFG